ncbi:MAG TPA: hypothetical protein PKY96_05955, partial [Flavobacteriales bacterium]|nr:hypothetical protein [Flavobacteriales bacterium]
MPGQIFTILEFHDTLFIGGQFLELNGMPSGRVAFHDGSTWRPYGNIQSGAVVRLRALGDTLYALGPTGQADGSPMKGVAKRVGNEWLPVGQINHPDPIVSDLALYDGELVMASNASVGSARSLFHLVDGEWLPLGGGIQGGLSAAGYLEVLHGRLYIGGQFSPAQGNAGKDVMYWDGEAYHPMGSGIQNNPGNNGGICTGALSQHDGKLWVNHGCYFAGGIESKGLAYWDGIQWCGVPGDLASYAGGAYRTAWYRDTLFVTLYGDMADGVQTGRVAKFVGSSYTGQCSGPVGMPAPEQPSDMLRVTEFAPDQWRLDGLAPGTYALCL